MTKERFCCYYKQHYKPILDNIREQVDEVEVGESEYVILDPKDFRLLALLRDDLEEVFPELQEE